MWNVFVDLHDQLLSLGYFDVRHILVEHIAHLPCVLNGDVVGNVSECRSLHMHRQNGAMILLNQMMVD